MQTVMLRLDALIRRRRRLFLAVWALIVLAALPFAARQSEHLSGGGFDVPGSQSVAVQQAVERDFDRRAGRRRSPPCSSRARTRPTAQLRAALADVGAAAGDVDDVTLTPAARAQRAAPARRRRPAHARRPAQHAASATPTRSTSPSTCASSSGSSTSPPTRPVATHLVGQGALWAGMQDLTKEDLASAEAVGFPIVLLILLAVFGSLVAALMPVALGVVAVMVTGALIYALSLVTGMSVFVTNMASMIGIGVAVDYSLFVLARYREEIAAGRGPDDARAIALATSGVAVTFSGLTVIVSLAGLFIVDTMSVRSMALGAILVVAVSVLAATTLLPALISLAGRRAWEPGRVVASVTGWLARPAVPRRRGVRAPRARLLLGALDRRDHAPPGARRGRLDGGPARARDPGAAAGDAQRRAAAVPRGHETRVGVEAAARR